MRDFWVSPPTDRVQSANVSVLAASTGVTVTQAGASATTPVLIVKLGATPGAGGDAIEIQDSSGNVVATVTAAGLLSWIAANTQTTVGAAGTASALPAQPTGYLKMDVDGTTVVVPYYAAS